MRRIFIILIIVFLLSGIFFNLVFANESKSILRTCAAWPTYIDPAVGSDTSSSTALVNLYDSLFYPDENGKPQSHLAESWESSEDGLTRTFYLRKGVKFHDGTELTAEDVKFSMDRLTTIGEGYGFLFTSRVDKTEIIDDYTVSFHLNGSFGPFVSTLCRLYILNKDLVMANIKKPGSYGEMGDYGKEYLLNHDAGSGPYKVKEFPLEQYLLMEKNDEYWLPIDDEAPAEFKMLGVTEPVTLRTMITRRELEIIDLEVSVETVAALKKIEGIDIMESLAGEEFYYMIHNKKPPTDDIHFRKAMAWAFDYNTVVEQLYPGSIQSIGPVPQDLPGADTTVFQYYRDLDKAKEELKQSKYFGQLEEYPVEVHWCAEVPDEEKVALLFMSNMADIGINVQVVKVPWMSMVEECGSIESSPHIVTIFDAPSYAEAGAILEARYKSDSAATWEQNEWLLDSNLDKMIDDAINTIDREERFKKYSDIQHFIVDLCPTLFLFDFMQNRPYQAAYVDWPAAKGKVVPLLGYNLAGRFIKVYPEKRDELLK